MSFLYNRMLSSVQSFSSSTTLSISYKDPAKKFNVYEGFQALWYERLPRSFPPPPSPHSPLPPQHTMNWKIFTFLNNAYIISLNLFSGVLISSQAKERVIFSKQGAACYINRPINRPIGQNLHNISVHSYIYI